MRALFALIAAASFVACAPARGVEDDGESAHAAQRIEAPSWLLSSADHGIWTEGGVVRAWADARVANTRFDKRVLAEVIATYEGGTAITTLHPAVYKGRIGDGERWGTDAIELHAVGPNGARATGDVFLRFRLQHARDGREVMVETPWTRLQGSGPVPSADPWAPGIDSPVRAAGPVHAPEIRFAPFDDPGALVVREIDAVIAAKTSDPAGRHTIHAAVFNIGDARIVDRLIAAHRGGVEVRLITDAKKLRPSATWMTGDDALLAAGVPLLGVGYGGRAAMHLKIALFDGKKVVTGSANWEHGSSFENHENLVLLDDPAVVAAYAQRFERLAGSAVTARTGSRDATFGPDEAPYRVVGELVDRARTSIHVAMFTAKDFRWDGSVSLFDKLIAARRRGVDVVLVTDAGIAEGGEYHGVVGEDDPTDERLAENGVTVVRADVPFAKYASMHHKFMVVDGKITAFGALNWYHDAAFLNDEDLLVVRDATFAARFEGEVAELCRRYDEGFDPSRWPSVQLTFDARNDRTRWGEELVVLGDLPELGAWDPARALALDGRTWPTFRTTLALPAGVRARFKLAVRRTDGSLVWESGDDRSLTVATGTGAQTVNATYR